MIRENLDLLSYRRIICAGVKLRSADKYTRKQACAQRIDENIKPHKRTHWNWIFILCVENLCRLFRVSAFVTYLASDELFSGAWRLRVRLFREIIRMFISHMH